MGSRGSFFNLYSVQVYIFDVISLFVCDENVEKVINRSWELGCRDFLYLGCKWTKSLDKN